MNARQRRDLIASRILERGRVQVADLTAEFGVTDTSIRRDLTILEEMGQLRRVYGGAVSTARAHQVASFEDKMHSRGLEKQRIGARAIEFVHPDDVIILDSGTTVLQMARHLPGPLRPPGALRIVTNSVSLAGEIGTWAAPNLLLLGGIYLPDHQATVGPEALEGLGQLTADTAFLGCDGWTIAGGITTAHPLIAEVGRMMAERARKVIVLADSSKLLRAGFVSIIPTRRIDLMITDSAAPAEIVSILRDEGVEVILT
jgi:DeoR/GlpR family transcriptional regulator of sugar metabolism